MLYDTTNEQNDKIFLEKTHSFKKFMAFHVWQATERVRTELRLLVDAFLNRGHLKFKDLETPVMVGRAVDKGDLGSGLITFHDKAAPGSHLVCEVRVMTRVGEGVVGIQLVMTGGKRTQELPVRGAAAGESRSTRAHSFTIDAPVERFSRLECEHEGGLIERLRVVTSGGRVSPWFGEMLTLSPHAVDLPDWQQRSLAATTAKAAAAAWVSTGNVPRGSDEFSKQRAAEAATAAAEAAAVAAAAPPWDAQKEYITGLVGVRTQNRLVGLGVITRHVTSSHVFSYIWEAAEEDEGANLLKRKEDVDRQRKNSSSSSSGTSSTVKGSSLGKSVNSSCTGSGGSLCSGSIGGGSSSVVSGSLPASGNIALGQPQPQSASARQPAEMNSSSGICSSVAANSLSTTSSSLIPGGVSLGKALTRAEAKQERFAKEMRDREKKKEEHKRQAKQTEERMQRLIQGGKVRGIEEDGKGASLSGEVTSDAEETGRGHSRGRARRPRAPPTPQEEFASVLRMRRTDARRALERSIALARAARKYRGDLLSRGDDSNDDGEGGGPLSSMSVVMGLTTWLHEALLPQLVPLPVPAAATAELFQKAESALMEARMTKVRGQQMLHAAEGLQEKRQQRPRKGVMSPAQRTREVTEREVSFCS